MPNYIVGNLWEAETDIIAVTTNGVVRQIPLTQKTLYGPHYELVMGAGAALECRNKYPGVRLLTAIRLAQNYKFINTQFDKNGLREYWFRYGFITFENVGLFQTKIDYREKSTLSLIEYSVTRLNEFLEQNTTKTVAINFPGIGYGGLPKVAVQKLTDELNDRVSIYSLK